MQPGVEGNQVALRSSVDDIKRMARNLSRSEMHALAVWCAMQYSPQVGQFRAAAELIEVKTRASSVFGFPAHQWETMLAEHANQTTGRVLGVNVFRCGCSCGCQAVHGCGIACMSCGRWNICSNCKPRDADAFVRMSRGALREMEVCHECAGRPRLVGKPLDPPQLLGGLQWYFNYPYEGIPPVPKAWYTRNRNAELDPLLLDIEEIYKRRELVNRSRRTLPVDWQLAFDVIAVFQDLL